MWQRLWHRVQHAYGEWPPPASRNPSPGTRPCAQFTKNLEFWGVRPELVTIFKKRIPPRPREVPPLIHLPGILSRGFSRGLAKAAPRRRRNAAGRASVGRSPLWASFTSSLRLMTFSISVASTTLRMMRFVTMTLRWLATRAAPMPMSECVSAAAYHTLIQDFWGFDSGLKFLYVE